jgi:hypothetical protein
MTRQSLSTELSSPLVVAQPRRYPRRLTRELASAYLLDVHGITRTPKTLAKLATVGGGPPFRKFGRAPMYAPEDLDAWVEGKVTPLVTSTSALAT